MWSRPGLLERPTRLPFATLPGAAALAIYTAEVTVHTWDLAVATGQRPRWDDTVVAAALAASKRILPAEGCGPEVPFGPGRGGARRGASDQPAGGLERPPALTRSLHAGGATPPGGVTRSTVAVGRAA